MERDVLSKVIEAEKEIQKCLEIEKGKVREWLDGVKREADEERLLEQEKIKASLERAAAEAGTQAEARAAEITGKAVIAAERTGKLKKEILTGIIRKRITGILPG